MMVQRRRSTKKRFQEEYLKLVGNPKLMEMEGATEFW